MRSGLSLVLAALIATPAAAQSPTPYDRAIAAGYKAAMLCSGIFNAGRSEAQIAADELTGIYPQYDAIVPTLDAQVDRETATVTVAFDIALPPRRATWRQGFGCTNQPIGATPPPIMAFQAAPPISSQPDARPWPMGDADAMAKPAPTADAATAAAFDAARYGEGVKTTAVVVIKNGLILSERYRDGFGPFVSQRTWSVGKSIAGTLIGIAARDGLIDPAQPAAIPEWGSAATDPRRRITIDNLLRMASGLHSDTAGNRTDAIYFGGTAVTEQATGWPLEALPGTRFRYANNDILLAARALRASLGDTRYAAFPAAVLFDRIGMTHSVAETDWQGNFILSSQFWSTARDLARFGLLYLNDGLWNGERILPEGWVKYATTPSGPQPEGPFGYGATWWLMNNSPGVPADSFAAFGNRGQFVVVVPSRQVVIVRRGEDPGAARFDIARFTADMLAAIE